MKVLAAVMGAFHKTQAFCVVTKPSVQTVAIASILLARFKTTLTKTNDHDFTEMSMHSALNVLIENTVFTSPTRDGAIISTWSSEPREKV